VHQNILFLLLFSSVLSAEYLEIIKVSTGTRTTKILSEAPVKTEVVTAKEIENTHAKNVSEAIKNIPGLIIKDTHGKDGSSVWIQGFNADRVLILIDGEPMTSATGQIVDLSQLSTSDIQNIEIIKGAASALYGSQAMGGVINIITKKAKKGLHNKVTLEIGTYADKSAEDILPQTLLKAQSTYNNGEYIAAIFTDYIYDTGIKLEDSYTYQLPKRNKFNIKGEYRILGKNEFYIKPMYFYENDEKPFATYIPGIGDIQEKRTQEVNKFRVSMGTNITFKNEDTLKVTAFGERYISDSYQDKLATPYMEKKRNAIIDLAQADLQYDTSIADIHVITTGLQFHFQHLQQNSTKKDLNSTVEVDELFENATANAIEGYIQDDWFLTESLELLPGIRYQYDSDFGSYISPKLSLFYTKYIDNNKLNIRMSYGNGYRVPSLKERYFSFDQSQYGILIQGNPNLQPESSKSYQLSAEYLDKGGYTLALNLFYNDIEDLIDVIKNKDKSKPGLDVYEYTNINKAFTHGLEFEYGFNFYTDFRLSGGYTYLYSEDKTTNKHLPNRPENQIKTTLQYSTKKTNIQASISYESEEFIDEENEETSPATTLLDIKMTKHVTKLFSIYCGINNLLDEHENPQNDNDVRQKSPRYIYLGSTYKF